MGATDCINNDPLPQEDTENTGPMKQVAGVLQMLIRQYFDLELVRNSISVQMLHSLWLAVIGRHRMG